MKYYKFTSGTPYCGTEGEHYVKSAGELSKGDLEALTEEYAEQAYEDYSYLHSGWNDEYLDTPPTPDEEMTENFVTTATLTGNGNTLILEGAISVKYYFGIGKDATKFETAESAIFYFWTEQDYNALKAAGTPLSKDNASYTKSAELVYSGSVYGYEFTAASDEFVAKEIGSALYSTLCITDADGIEHCSGIGAFSPEAYAYQKINDGKEASIDTLVKWLTVYGEYAKIYFESK